MYLLPDLSVAVESGMSTQKGYACRLTKYDAKAKNSGSMQLRVLISLIMKKEIISWLFIKAPVKYFS